MVQVYESGGLRVFFFFFFFDRVNFFTLGITFFLTEVSL